MNIKGDIIKSCDVVVRLATVRKYGGEMLKGRPSLSRPHDKSALGIMSSIRIDELRLDLTVLGAPQSSVLSGFSPDFTQN